MWILGTLFLILIILLYLDTRKPPNFPPGPAWLPILGNTLLLYRLRKKYGYLYKVTAKLAEKHGCVGLRIGKERIVFAYSYEANRELFTKEDFQGRPKGPFYQTRTWGLRRGLLVTDEDFWQEQRRFVLRQLREFGYGRRDMSSIVEDESIQIIKDVKEKLRDNNNNGIIVQMESFFGIYVLNTLWTMMAGIRYSADDEELKHLQRILYDLFKSIDMVGTLFSQFPILQYVAPDFSGYTNFVRIHQRIWKFIRNEIEKHKKTFKPDVLRDLIDVYLQELQSPDKGASFSESQLVAVCMDLFMAGSETTNKTLGFAFLYMLLKPEVQRRIQEEIDQIVGHERMPQLIDRAKMPYTEGFVLESVRMFMIRSFNVPHRTLRDTKLLGYDVPKDTMVLANYYGILRDCENPDDFCPERFIKDGKIFIPDNYMPFGLNKHRCLGETLAKANVFLFTTSLLQKFNFRLPPGVDPSSFGSFEEMGVEGCTPGPVPFKALITYRDQKVS